MRPAPHRLAIFCCPALSMLRIDGTPTLGKSSGFTVVITGLLCYTAAAFKPLG